MEIFNLHQRIKRKNHIEIQYKNFQLTQNFSKVFDLIL